MTNNKKKNFGLYNLCPVSPFLDSNLENVFCNRAREWVWECVIQMRQPDDIQFRAARLLLKYTYYAPFYKM